MRWYDLRKSRLRILFLSALWLIPAAFAQESRGPIHRYSFNQSPGGVTNGAAVVDSSGTAHGIVRGLGVTATSTGLRLPGGKSSSAPYIDLPNGIASGRDRLPQGYTNVSYEIWLTVHEHRNWSRAFDFGTSTVGEITAPGGNFAGKDYFMISVNEGLSPNAKMERIPGAFQTAPRATELGVLVHWAATYDSAANLWTMYQNGVELHSFSSENGPRTIPDVNVWLGRSNFSTDDNTSATFEEFRIYDYALLPQKIWDSFRAGPDKLGATDSQHSTPVPPRRSTVVQLLKPGFTVRELPVRLTALNNIEYAPDGRLFAGGYDGRFHVLRDTDGDKLEERVDTISAKTSDDYPLGLVVKDGMPHALLANELIRFRDQDGDGVPETREVVAKGWDDPKLTTNAMILHRRVDSAMALAAGPDDSWYLTMGSANPGNGYWQDTKEASWDATKAGSPHYSTNVLRGCLLRIDKQGQVTRLNSGLRYIMSLQWNEHGDLFGTDQEGATWLPNGNPFDELLHIQEGRHYGFPPRHPRLLPHVIDEPSVWDFAPQHQSVCGFRFNGPRPGVGRFGPAGWEHDAILTGASRGKLWRTKLAKTAAGYVAQTELIASLGMIAVDCAISPKGDLVVACHDGPPDWGSGPTALGKLFKISYSDTGMTPQPLAVWAASPTETSVEFDRSLKEAPAGISIEYGHQVQAADRLEKFRPGYGVIKLQDADPRKTLAVNSAELSRDGKTLTLRTPPRTDAHTYAITLPSPTPEEGKIDLAYQLTGVSFGWTGARNKTITGWLPHLDFTAVRTLTTPRRAQFFQALASVGELKLQCQVDLRNMLHPAVQPGSTLDYTPQPEVITLVLDSDVPFTVQQAGIASSKVGLRHQELRYTNTITTIASLVIHLKTPATRLDVAYFTKEDARLRPLGLTRILAPFAKLPTTALRKQPISEISGGNWKAGKDLYFGKATCSTCHQIRGEGSMVGPDLSNLTHRDYASVLRDIQEPSATINPDAISYTIKLRDEEEVTGIRSSETATELKIVTGGGVIIPIKKEAIVSRTVNKLSLMPAGLLDNWSAQEIKDLMTFLLSEPRESVK